MNSAASVAPVYESFADIFTPAPLMTALFTISLAIIVGAILGATRIGRLVLPELSGRDRWQFGISAGAAMLVLLAISYKGMFENGDLFWIAAEQRATAEAEASREMSKILSQACGGAASVPFSEQDVTYSGRGATNPTQAFASYRLVSKHGSCSEKFSIEWRAKEGHYLHVLPGSDLLKVDFVSRNNKHGFYQRPHGVPLADGRQPATGHAFSAISVSGWAEAKQPFKRRECGATVTILAAQLPMECLHYTRACGQSS